LHIGTPGMFERGVVVGPDPLARYRVSWIIH